MTGGLDLVNLQRTEDVHAHNKMYLGKTVKDLIILVMVASIVGVLSYKAGYGNGFEFGSSNGYSKGQVDLALDISKEINIKIGAETDKRSYEHFRDVQDITLYIVEKNDIKTIAIWE